MKKGSLCAIVCLIWLTACTPSNNARVIKSRSIDSLKNIVEFCMPIKSVNWKIKTYDNERIGTEYGSNKDVLCAEIECDIPQMQAFKNSFVSDRNNEPVTDAYVASAFLNDWFSEDVKNAFYEEDGNWRPRGRAYKVNPKVVQTTLFNDGWFSFVGDDKVLLVLSQ